MANENLPKGLQVAAGEAPKVRKFPVGASETFGDGDVVYFGTDGLITFTRNAGFIAGVAVGSIIDGITGATNTSSSAVEGEDQVLVAYDPNQEFIAQITTGALTDPYTTGASASAFDVAGATSVQYIDAGSTASDEVKIIGPAFEANGNASAVGAYQKVFCMFNPDAHAFAS